jgi:hypothetical protein
VLCHFGLNEAERAAVAEALDLAARVSNQAGHRSACPAEAAAIFAKVAAWDRLALAFRSAEAGQLLVDERTEAHD